MIEALIFITIGMFLGWFLALQVRPVRKAHLVTRPKPTQAQVDPISGAYSRRWMEAYLQEAWSRATQDKKPFSLLLIDLHEFKKINHHHGHGAGDRVLRTTVKTLMHHTRRSDRVCRYGADEFLLILPHCLPEHALELAGRLRVEMAKITFSHAKGPFKADFSIGVVEFRKDIPSLGQLIRRLEEALDQAKKEDSGVVLAS